MASTHIPGFQAIGDAWPQRSPLAWDLNEDRYAVADGVLFLLSDTARRITGEVLTWTAASTSWVWSASRPRRATPDPRHAVTDGLHGVSLRLVGLLPPSRGRRAAPTLGPPLPRTAREQKLPHLPLPV